MGAASFGGVTWAQFIFAINTHRDAGCFYVMWRYWGLSPRCFVCVPQLVGSTKNRVGEELCCLLKVQEGVISGAASG